MCLTRTLLRVATYQRKKISWQNQRVLISVREIGYSESLIIIYTGMLNCYTISWVKVLAGIDLTVNI